MMIHLTTDIGIKEIRLTVFGTIIMITNIAYFIGILTIPLDIIARSINYLDYFTGNYIIIKLKIQYE